VEQEDAEPDRPDNQGGTPSLWAANYGHEGVVKLLLDRKDVGSNRAGMHNRSLLRWVAFAGHEDLSSYRYYLAGKMSTPIAQMRMIEGHLDVLL